jgi:hypothetical protein|tara:strand:- start:949 stop:1224 length:276 start_codon:yes stop_codon:yes gene_type:complete
MNYTDIINGCWELLGALFTIPSITSLLKEKKAIGISWVTVIFFLAWGLWNVFFYPVNNLMYSFVGGVILSITNIIWFILIIKYHKKKDETI